MTMELTEIKSWLIAATITSLVIGFITSTLSTKKKYGAVYNGVILSSWGKVFITLLPIFIYSASSLLEGGWDKFLRSPELAVAAFLILLMANNELGGALAINHNREISHKKVKIISMASLLLLTASIITAVLVFKSAVVTTPVVIWQIVLLILSVLAFFSTASVVNLVKEGYWPNQGEQP